MTKLRAIVDLSHWDVCEQFTAAQVAILVHGHDPNVVLDPNQTTLGSLQSLFLPVFERMRRSYDKTRHYFRQPMNPPAFFREVVQSELLQSVRLCDELACSDTSEGRHCFLYEWLGDDSLSSFDTQRFSVKESARWLEAVGQLSIYKFGGINAISTTSTLAGEDFDPSDLPHELDYANQAFRAVSNGGGGSAATFKNRLMGYLEETHPGLTTEAVKRIATVANPDKSPGRPKNAG